MSRFITGSILVSKAFLANQRFRSRVRVTGQWDGGYHIAALSSLTGFASAATAIGLDEAHRSYNLHQTNPPGQEDAWDGERGLDPAEETACSHQSRLRHGDGHGG